MQITNRRCWVENAANLRWVRLTDAVRREARA
jgi:hypothetical protein